jgi:hypothetical protein
MKARLLVWTLALLAAGCCCTKKGKCTAPAAAPTAATCGNQLTDPTCSALVATAFCQAKAPSVYGNCELWATSRGFHIPAADKGKTYDQFAALDFGAPNSQTCQQACEALGEALTKSGSGWKTVVYADGHPMGIADFAAEFRGLNGTIFSIGGRPDSVYLQSDPAWPDWCCCARSCDVGSWGVVTKRAAARSKK